MSNKIHPHMFIVYLNTLVFVNIPFHYQFLKGPDGYVRIVYTVNYFAPNLFRGIWGCTKVRGRNYIFTYRFIEFRGTVRAVGHHILEFATHDIRLPMEDKPIRKLLIAASQAELFPAREIETPS